MRTFFRFLFWTAGIFAFVMAVLPHPPEPLHIHIWDKLQHFTAFAVLMALGITAYPQVGLVRMALALSAFGAFIEVVQGLPVVHRDADVHDRFADTLAILTVLLALRTRKPITALALFAALAHSRGRREERSRV